MCMRKASSLQTFFVLNRLNCVKWPHLARILFFVHMFDRDASYLSRNHAKVLSHVLVIGNTVAGRSIRHYRSLGHFVRES